MPYTFYIVYGKLCLKKSNLTNMSEYVNILGKVS